VASALGCVDGVVVHRAQRDGRWRDLDDRQQGISGGVTPLAVPLLLKPRPHVGTTALITWRTAVDADEIAEDELSDASR
jgi:hypothetical protein